MKFREFVSWCNQRAVDGCWGMLEAMVCVDRCVKSGSGKERSSGKRSTLMMF